MSKSDEIAQRFKMIVETVNSLPWGKLADMEYLKDQGFMKLKTDIGFVIYYLGSGKIQVKSHQFSCKGDAEFIKFMDHLVKTGDYLWHPVWSSRPSEQDKEWLKKVRHPFVERAK